MSRLSTVPTEPHQRPPKHGRRRLLGGLVALGAAGGAAAFGWLRFQRRPASESAFGRTTTVSSPPPSVVDGEQEPQHKDPRTATPTTEHGPEPTTLASVAVPVICRRSWGAADATTGLQSHTVERLTVHHTASPISRVADGPGAIRGHQRFHQTNRGWPDIAYHFLVDPAGNIYQGRDSDFRGDTTTNYDPSGHFLVCLDGNYDQADVNDSQAASLAAVLAWGASHYGVDPFTLAGHRDYADTKCPGDSLHRLLTDGSLLKRVEAVLAEGQPMLVDVCGAAGDLLIDEIEASTEHVST